MSAVAEGRGLIHKGDKTTTGGVVTSGVGSVMFVGEGVTQTGMIATCRLCKKGQGKIVPLKVISVIVDGIQAALHGDIVACDCPYGTNTVIASAGAMSFSVKNGIVTGYKPFSSTEETVAAYSNVAAMAGARKEFKIESKNLFNIKIELQAENGITLPEQEFKAVFEDGSEQVFKTDNKGISPEFAELEREQKVSILLKSGWIKRNA